MDKLQALAQDLEAKRAAVEALFGKLDSDTPVEALKSINDEIKVAMDAAAAAQEAFDAEKALVDAREANRKALDTHRAFLKSVTNALPHPTEEGATKSVAFAVPKRHSGVFTGDDGALKAYTFGRLVLAAAGHRASGEWLEAKSAVWPAIKAGQNENDNAAGGVLVPDELSADIINLTDEYGVFRRYARRMRMSRDTMIVPRVSGRLSTYYPGEGGGSSSNETNDTFDSVSLTARKLLTLVPYTSEVGEDAIIDMGDFIGREIGRQFAKAEDNAGFLGDGTATYGNIVGLSPAFQAVVTDGGGTWATDAANAANIQVAAGNNWSEITLANLHGVLAKVPPYARANAKWYCNQAFYYEVMLRLATAAGGATSAEIIGLPGGERFLGLPVVFVQVMPATEANSAFGAYCGDLALAALFGDRRELRLDVSSEYKFASDQLTVRGTERYDIKVHDLGNYHATAASRVLGPLAGLLTAAA